MSATVDLPIRVVDGLSEERKSSIKNALQKYRKRVLEQNMRALEGLIEEIESVPPIVWPGTKCREDEVPRKRIENLWDHHDIWLDPPDLTVTTVRDFLSEDRRESLIRTCRLDGITHGEVDIAARNAWIEDVERRMSKSERAEVRPDGLPADLKYLMTLVRGLYGPGLPEWRFYNQLKFLSDLDGDEDTDIGKNQGTEAGWIAVPNTQEEVDNGQLGDLPREWGDCEVAMAVGAGQCSFAVYCRKQENGERDSDGAWGWKFGQQDPPCESGLYDTIEEFLEWYAERPDEG